VAKATEFVEQQMVFPNTQVLNHSEYVKNGKRYIDVTLIGAALPKDSLQLAMMNKLDSVGLGGTQLNIRQGFSLAPSAQIEDKDYDRFYALMQSRIAEGENTIDSLRRELRDRDALSGESARIAPEVKVLFPSVKDIALSEMTVASEAGDTTALDTISVIFANAPAGLSRADRGKLVKYVSVRLRMKNLHLILNPTDFPWPKAK
jgi:hypothetical protein BACCOPRO_00271